MAAEIIPLAAVVAAEAYPVRKESLLGKRKAGRATNKTPVKAMRPANASLTVNGSRRATQAMKAVRVGTRNVMTVASDTSRYDRESDPVLAKHSVEQLSLYLQYSPNSPTDPAMPLKNKRPLTSRGPIGKSGTFSRHM